MNMIAPAAMRYRAPCLTVRYAALARALSRRRGVQDADGFALRVVTSPAQIVAPRSFDLTLGDAGARITLPGQLVHDLLMQLDQAAPGAAPDVVVLLLELAIEPLLVRLEALVPSLTVALRPTVAQNEAAVFTVGLAVRYGGVDGTVQLDLDADAADLLVAALAHLPDCPDGVPDLPVWVHVRQGCALVTTADLMAARAGDVIPVDTLPDGDLLLVLGERFVWRTRREDAGLLLLTRRLRPRAIGLERWMMDEAIEDDAAELDDLPVRLAFELGRLELPLAEVTTLGEGHVFELAREVAQPVDILANGRRIGRGRIVDIAGSLGVQIVRIGRE